MTTLNEQIVETRTELEELEQRPARLAAKLAELEGERAAQQARRVQALAHYHRTVEPAQSAEIAALVARRTALRGQYLAVAVVLAELIEGVKLYDADAKTTAQNVIEARRVAAQLAGERFWVEEITAIFDTLSFGTADTGMLNKLSIVQSAKHFRDSDIQKISLFTAGYNARQRAAGILAGKTPTIDALLNEWSNEHDEDQNETQETLP